ncbi:MAG: flagellar hook-length control protein FliK, partial [bacterium]
ALPTKGIVSPIVPNERSTEDIRVDSNKKMDSVKLIGGKERNLGSSVKEMTKDFTGSNFMFLSSDTRLISHTKEDPKLIDVFQKIYGLISDRISGDTSKGEAILNLHPALPGELRVGISLDENRISIRLVASNDLIGDFISNSLVSLKRDLIQNGFDIISLNVYIMGNGSGNYRERENYNWHFFYHSGVKGSDIIEVEDNAKNLIDFLA